MYINIKKWFLIITVCALGWMSGFAIYWMIGPTILPLLNKESQHQSSQKAYQERLQIPAMITYPEQAGLQDAVLRNTKPAYEVIKIVLI